MVYTPQIGRVTPLCVSLPQCRSGTRCRVLLIFVPSTFITMSCPMPTRAEVSVEWSRVVLAVARRRKGIRRSLASLTGSSDRSATRRSLVLTLKAHVVTLDDVATERRGCVYSRPEHSTRRTAPESAIAVLILAAKSNDGQPQTQGGSRKLHPAELSQMNTPGRSEAPVAETSPQWPRTPLAHAALPLEKIDEG